MMREIRMYACMFTQGYVRLGLVLGRHLKINLFGLHYCGFCCEVETKYQLDATQTISYRKKTKTKPSPTLD